jgi:chromate transport protein ChrA
MAAVNVLAHYNVLNVIKILTLTVAFASLAVLLANVYTVTVLLIAYNAVQDIIPMLDLVQIVHPILIHIVLYVRIKLFRSCMTGYRLNSSNLCQKCSPECLFCNSTNHCFDCISTMYLTTNFTC